MIDNYDKTPALFECLLFSINLTYPWSNQNKMQVVIPTGLYHVHRYCFFLPRLTSNNWIMALGDTSQDTTALEDGVRKASSGTGSHDDACEEQHILSPPGICDVCAEFYNFLVSGKLSLNVKSWRSFISILHPRVYRVWLIMFLLLFTVERRLHIAAEENNHDAEPVLKKDQMNTMYQYLGIWVQR